MSKVFVVVTLLSFSLLSSSGLCAGGEKDKADAPEILRKVVQQTLGEVTILRTEAQEKAPVTGLEQRRVWIETVYGETPVLFYETEDGKFMFAGTIFDASGENLTKRDVGKTIPRRVEESRLELNEDYMIGKKDAPVKAALWIGPDRFSRTLFKTFYDLQARNKDKVVLFIKFFPLTKQDMEKMKAVTCYKNEKLLRGIQTVLEANPSWGSEEDLTAYRKEGDPGACNDELVVKDLKLASALKLPSHPVVFVNGVMLIENPTTENIARLAGIELKQE